MYKLISKIIAKSLKSVVCHIVDHSQFGFIQNRQILEIYLLTTELIKVYSRKGLCLRCMVQILRGQVEWCFFAEYDEEIRASCKIDRLDYDMCYHMSYSILVNGMLLPHFQTAKGLSPYFLPSLWNNFLGV